MDADNVGKSLGVVTQRRSHHNLAGRSLPRTHQTLGRTYGRSDYTASLRLGEAVAISILRDHRLGYNEPFGGFTFTTFDGVTVTM